MGIHSFTLKFTRMKLQSQRPPERYGGYAVFTRLTHVKIYYNLPWTTLSMHIESKYLTSLGFDQLDPMHIKKYKSDLIVIFFLKL